METGSVPELGRQFVTGDFSHWFVILYYYHERFWQCSDSSKSVNLFPFVLATVGSVEVFSPNPRV